jgi:DUF2075 family protein
LYGAEHWTLRTVDQKYLESFKIWCWRRVEKIGRTDCVRKEEVSHTVKKESNILHTIQGKNADWIGHILGRNCFLKSVIKGNIEEGI